VLDAHGFSTKLKVASPITIPQGATRDLEFEPCVRKDPNDPDVTQLNAEAIGHVMEESHASVGEDAEQASVDAYRIVVVQPHLYPGNGLNFAWVYSTPLDANDGTEESWVLSAGSLFFGWRKQCRGFVLEA
jgi:hypothetical protein